MPATLPVRGSAKEIGDRILMAPGPGGTLFVSIPTPDGAVLALLEHDGRPRSGWPIEAGPSTSCELLLTVEDGSVRALCSFTGVNRMGAFAFGPNGGPLAGWPVVVGRRFDGPPVARVIGREMKVFVPGSDVGSARIATISDDGSVSSGKQVQFGVGCCSATWAIGPDGIAYGTLIDFGDSAEAPKTSALAAVSSAGSPIGFPVAIDGVASQPAFDGAGRVHLTVVAKVGEPARMLVFGPNGRRVPGGSGVLGITATDLCTGVEGSCEVPAAPLVGPDGTTFVIESRVDRTTAASVDPSGEMAPGWPYRTPAGYQEIGSCPPNAACDSVSFASAARGPDGTLYLLHPAATSAVGGRVVAIGLDGRVRSGWPVALRRSGSGFWAVVVGPDRTAYALAIEPESGKSSSATILGIAPDGSVLYKTTIVDP